MTIDQIALRWIKENGLYPKFLNRTKRNVYNASPINWLVNTSSRMFYKMMTGITPSFMSQFLNRRIELYIMNSKGLLTTKTTSYYIKGFDTYRLTFLIGEKDSHYSFLCDMRRIESISGAPVNKWHLGDIIDEWRRNPSYELIDPYKPFTVTNTIDND